MEFRWNKRKTQRQLLNQKRIPLWKILISTSRLQTVLTGPNTVNDLLKNIRERGLTVDFNIDWFIEAIDNYYVKEANKQSDELIIEIITVSGVAEGLIKQEK